MAALLQVAFTPIHPAVGTAVRIWVSRQLSAGVSQPDSMFLLLVATQAAIGNLSPRTLTPSYTAKFGPLISGSRIFVDVQFVSPKGILGPTLRRSVVVS
jgi:hypothetical protein